MTDHVASAGLQTRYQAGVTGRRRNGADSAAGYQVCLVAFLVANAFSGERFGLPLPVGPDRILFGLLLLLFILDPRVRWRSWFLTPPVVVAALALLSAALSAQFHGTLTTKTGAFELLDRLAIPYLLFALAPLLLSTRRSRLLLLQMLCLLGIYLGLTAIFEVLGPHALVFPHYIADPGFGVSYGRAQGPLGSSDADAVVMATSFFASLALRAVTIAKAWRMTTAVSAMLCLGGVLLALTRAEWIGMTLAIIVTGLIVPSTRRKLPAAIAALALAVIAALTISPALRADVTDRASTSSSIYDRQNTNAGGFRAIRSDPLFGIGWAEFVGESSDYVRQDSNYPLTRTDIEIHNVPLARVAELGLLGGGLWIVSVLLGPVSAMFVRRRHDPLDEALRVAFIGVCVVWLVAIQFSPFAAPLPTALVWLLAGLVLAPARGTLDERAGDGPVTTADPHAGNRIRPVASLAQWWALAIFLILIGAVLGGLLANVRSVSYTAESRLVVGADNITSYEVPGYARASQQLASNYSRYVDTNSLVSSQVRHFLGPRSGRLTSLSATPIPGSCVISVEAVATTPPTARRAAQEVAERLVRLTTANLIHEKESLLKSYIAVSDETDRATRRASAVSGEIVRAKFANEPQQALTERLLTAQAHSASLRLRQITIRNQYLSTMRAPPPDSVLYLIQPAAIVADDSTSMVQIYAVGGGAVGLVIGVLVASLLELGRLRRSGKPWLTSRRSRRRWTHTRRMHATGL